MRILFLNTMAYRYNIRFSLSMEDSLLAFLSSRDTPLEIIQHFQHEKVDCQAILLMDDATLCSFLPALGDRLSVIEYCKKKTNPLNSKKFCLLERLKNKIKTGTKNKQVGDEVAGTSGAGTNQMKKTKLSKHKNVKDTRFINVGWFVEETPNNMKHIRAKEGGGSRRLEMKKTAVKDDILDKAKELFFPGGVSKYGSEENFIFNLVDFSRSEIDNDLTIGEMYKLTGLTTLRFYLISSVKHTHDEGTTALHSQDSVMTNNNLRVASEKEMALLSDEEDYSVEDYDKSLLNEDIYASTIEPIVLTVDNEKEILLSDNEYSFNEESLLNEHACTNEPSVGSTENNASLHEPPPMTDSGEDSCTITIHRGNEFKELLSAFCSFPLDYINQIDIKMILPNGEEEKGIDAGGVWRDCITEFWDQFYEMCTEGTGVKVPCIRHDFREEQWIAIANILKKGWISQQFFPLLLSPSFVEYTIFGTVSSTIKEDFLKQISQDDANLISTALANFPEEEEEIDDLLTVLDTFGTKLYPTKENFNNLVFELAHKEILQKPQFVVSCWRPVLTNLFSRDIYLKCLQEGKPTAKNILKSFVTAVDVSPETKSTFDYLKRYIKESDDSFRALFLRFCTGTNMANKIITVSFYKSSAFTRTPIGHVCGRCLELPYPYVNYQEFRQEMNAVLSSKIWVMDLA